LISEFLRGGGRFRPPKPQMKQVTPGELRVYTLENGNQGEFPAPGGLESKFSE
jgi:hypothetical protein